MDQNNNNLSGTGNPQTNSDPGFADPPATAPTNPADLLSPQPTSLPVGAVSTPGPVGPMSGSSTNQTVSVPEVPAQVSSTAPSTPTSDFSNPFSFDTPIQGDTNQSVATAPTGDSDGGFQVPSQQPLSQDIPSASPISTPSEVPVAPPTPSDNSWMSPSPAQPEASSPEPAEPVSPLPPPVAEPSPPPWMTPPSTPMPETPAAPSLFPTPEAPVSSESAPTDLTNLINTQPSPTPVQPTTIVSPTMSPEGPQVVSSGNPTSISKYILVLGGLVLIGVIAASAYFILGIGKSPETTTSLPIEQAPLTNPPKAITPATPTAVPAATGSATFGNIQGNNSSGAVTPAPTGGSGSSAFDKIQQRQQGL